MSGVASIGIFHGSSPENAEKVAMIRGPSGFIATYHISSMAMRERENLKMWRRINLRFAMLYNAIMKW